MSIKGIEGLSEQDLKRELREGGKFVTFQYCFSVIIMSFRRTSGIYYIPPGKKAIGKSIPFTLISLCFGLWGIPWGLIYTIGSIATNFSGGTDVTREVVISMFGAPKPKGPIPAQDQAAMQRRPGRP